VQAGGKYASFEQTKEEYEQWRVSYLCIWPLLTLYEDMKYTSWPRVGIFLRMYPPLTQASVS
jgi:hypothetical protein